MIEEYPLADLYLYADKIGIDYSVRNMRRLEQGLEIADNDIITSAPTAPMLPGMRAFFVPSPDDDSTIYTVEIYDQHRSTCTCPDKHQHCQHTLAVRVKDIRELEASWQGIKVTPDLVEYRYWANLFLYP